MGKGYSLDLRERIVAHVAAGGSRRGAARQFEVSDSCAVKLMARMDRTGSLEPARQGRPPGDGKLAAHRDFLIEQVEARPDITHAGTGGAAGGAARREGQRAFVVSSALRGGVLI